MPDSRQKASCGSGVMVAWPRLVAVEEQLKGNLIVSKCKTGGVCKGTCPVGPSSECREANFSSILLESLAGPKN